MECTQKFKKYKNKWCEVFFRHILTYQAGTYCLPKSKLEVIVQCLTWLVQFLGKNSFTHQKVWHIHPTSSPCCTATKLFPVHCHIIHIKTLKYHFPTVCTWGVMQLLVNPISSTILGLSPAQPRVNQKMGKTVAAKLVLTFLPYRLWTCHLSREK